MTPRNQEKKFNKSYSKELLKIAKGDLESAQILLEVKNRGRLDNICFLTHQAIEKAIKAVLVANEIPVPLIHELSGLIGKIPEKLNPPFGYELCSLNDYAAIRRYEEGESEVTQEELDKIIETGTLVLSWCEKIIK